MAPTLRPTTTQIRKRSSASASTRVRQCNEHSSSYDHDESAVPDKKKAPRRRNSAADATLLKTEPAADAHGKEPQLLFSLHENVGDADTSDALVLGRLVRRPSARNKSPYVADVFVPDLDREAVCHVPNLDMGGKCRPGVSVLMRRARDKQGHIVGPNATSPKFGTPKCEFIVQLLGVDESSFCGGDDRQEGGRPTKVGASPTVLYPPVWVGAHPSLGERIARAWIDGNLLVFGPEGAASAAVARVQSQVTIPEVPNRRFDFMIVHEDGSKTVVEVKTVVDCDYSIAAPPPPDLLKCRYLSSSHPHDYRRTAIFPWGSHTQKGGKDGKTLVVSSRAIHHVDELSRLVALGNYRAMLLFVVVRGDAEAFRPNHEACPEFVNSLVRARDAGVRVVAKRARFGVPRDASSSDNEGAVDGTSSTDPFFSGILHPEHCYSDIDLPVQWPDGESDLQTD